MASDYEAIKADNQKCYGTEVGHYGKSLLADLYDDRTHFIYELLQNAEDALRRHHEEPHTRTVRFDLSESELRVSHYGKPFDRRDVEGVCGIALSSKEGDLTRIGRFGIGFKSVYGVTDRPEIHSGDEDFGIDSFVWPSAQPAIARDREDQTIFIMPLRNPKTNGDEVADGLRRINIDTLLFLREIDRIEWSLPSGESGTCERQLTSMDHRVRQVTLTEEATGHQDIDQDWLIFSKPIHGDGEELAGQVEVAFLMEGDCIRPVFRSPLVVFFPTAVETNLGLRLQGPYHTTPSRDNVPKDDPWNHACVDRTGELLVEACFWLRDHDMLDVSVLKCLPIDKIRFGRHSMFGPLFQKIMEALYSHPLLPVFGGGYAPAAKVKVPRSIGLRNLFGPDTLADVFKMDGPLYWLSDKITNSITPELDRYLRTFVNVEEVRQEHLIAKLSTEFLERQSTTWVRCFYEFMSTQGALHRQAKEEWPLVRLSDGRHVVAYMDGAPQAYLPIKGRTGFPTIDHEVCSTAKARQFLEAIGLTFPDPVDDIIRNVLPKYKIQGAITFDVHKEDVTRIVAAFQTDSTRRRKKLMDELLTTAFVLVKDARGRRWEQPIHVYFRTDRLTSLFDGVEKAMFLDPIYDERVRSILRACGASRHLRGRDVERILLHMHSLSADERRSRAETLWHELVDIARALPSHLQTVEFNNAMRLLNARAWIPSGDEYPRVPSEVSFDALGWRSDPLLQSKIQFRPPAIDLLATRSGIDPKVLYMIKEHGLTRVTALQERLKLAVPSTPSIGNPLEDGNAQGHGTDAHPGGYRGSATTPIGPAAKHIAMKHAGVPVLRRTRVPYTFHSYVAVDHEDQNDGDPDDMVLEDAAIKFIRRGEPGWKTTPPFNEGFDLFQVDGDGQKCKWCEVKSMRGTLRDRPVGMSHAQFKCAQKHGDAYWLYVVERAGSDKARIVRIQDPAGKAKTFTFDKGWLDVAEVD